MDNVDSSQGDNFTTLLFNRWVSLFKRLLILGSQGLKLKRKVGLLSGICLIVGNMIGEFLGARDECT